MATTRADDAIKEDGVLIAGQALVLQLPLLSVSVVGLSGVVLMAAAPEGPPRMKAPIERWLEKDLGE